MVRVVPTLLKRETMGFDCRENEGLVGAENFQRCTHATYATPPLQWLEVKYAYHLNIPLCFEMILICLAFTGGFR